MKQFNKKLLLSSTCLMALALPATYTVQAQDQDSGVIAPEEFIVTARRRDENQTKVGITLNVLGKGALERRGIDNLEKVAANIPGLDMFRGNGSNNPTITLRGIGTTNPWSNNNQSVAAYIDGAYMPFSSLLTMPLFDMQRVEVLKGPQVALYGRNATAGAVNFISTQPGQDTEGYADITANNHSGLDFKAAASLAASDTFRMRLAAITQQSGGYMKRTGAGSLAGFTRVPGIVPGIEDTGAEDGYGDKDVFALRGIFDADLSDTFNANFKLQYGRDKSELIGSTNANGDRLRAFTPPNDAPYYDYDNVEPKTDTKQISAVLKLNWTVNDLVISSTSSLENMSRTYQIGDFVPTRIAEASFDEDIETKSQEVTISGETADNHKWIIGGVITQDDIDYFRKLTSHDLLLGELDTAFVEKDKAWATFGQVDAALNDTLSTTLGVRYTDESKSYKGGSIAVNPFGVGVVDRVYPNTAGDGIYGEPTYDEGNFSGKAALNWTPSENTLYYFSVGNGFKSGGFDGSGITEPSSFTPFKAETVWTYEMGTKITAMDGNFYFAGSLFYNDYTDKQVIALVDLGAGFPEAIIQNAAASEISGIDMEVKWRVSTPLTFSINGTYLDTEVTKWDSDDADDVAIHLGNELPGTPKLSTSVQVDWNKRVSDSSVMNISAWYTITNGSYRDIKNTEALRSEDSQLFNLRADLTFNEKWMVYVSAENIFDKAYISSVRSLVGMEGRYYNAPRTLKAGLKYQF